MSDLSISKDCTGAGGATKVLRHGALCVGGVTVTNDEFMLPRPIALRERGKPRPYDQSVFDRLQKLEGPPDRSTDPD